MTFLKWLAAAALLGSAAACVDNNTPSGGSYGYGNAPGGYDYNQADLHLGVSAAGVMRPVASDL